jgi:hypothetical protein
MKTGRLILLLLLLPLAVVFAQDESWKPFILSPEPGVYRDEIIVDISADREYESILYRVEGFDESQLVSADEGLILTSPRGARQEYRIELLLISRGIVQARAYAAYVIDRDPPEAPAIDPVPGIYPGAVSLRPDIPGASGYSYVLVGPDGSDRGSREAGEMLSIEGISGQLQAYQLQLGGIDDAGNRGEQKSFRYVIDRRSETRVDAIPVLSPAEGDFANPQLLYVDSRGFSLIRYTTDGSDPRINGTAYDGPVLLPVGDSISLRLYGLTHDQRELYRDVSYSAGINEYSSLEQGFISENVVVPALRSGLYYRADDRQASRYDNPLDRPLRISLQPGSLRALPLRIYDTVEQEEYRYLFLLEGRRPSRPDVQIFRFEDSSGDFIPVSDGEPVGRRIRIAFRTDPGTELFYRIGDLMPEVEETGRSRLYGDDELVLPSDVDELVLQFQARKNGTLWSEALTLTYPVLVPSDDPPRVEVSQDGNGVAIIPDGAVLMEILPEPSGYQPVVIEEATRLSLPAGVRQEYDLRFYGVDAAGGRSSEYLSFTGTVDTRTPAGPPITVDDRRLSLDAGEGQAAYYRLIKQGGEVPDDGGGFFLYGGPVDLVPEEGNNIGYIVEAYTEGPDGRSAVSRSPLIPVHSVTPAAARISGVSDGSAIAGERAKLRILNAEPGVRYYYSIGRDGEIPGNPYPGDLFTTSDIDIQLEGNQANQLIRLVIVPVSEEDDSLRGVPTRLSYSFDNTAPEPPTLDGIVAGSEYGESVSLGFRSDGDAGVFYEVQREGGDYLVPPDSVYAGPFTVTGIDGRRVVYRISAYSIDGAGNRSEEIRAAFTIDREFPDAALISVKDSSGRSLPEFPDRRYVSPLELQITFSSSEDVVYELARGTQTLNAPGTLSRRYSGPIKLDGEPGSETRYRLLFRSVDAAGNLGPSSGIFDFIIDRQPPAEPPSPRIQRDGNEGYFSWSISEDYTVEYAVLPAAVDPEAARFAEYQYPVDWEVADGQDSLVLYYRSRDEAGNASGLLSVVLPRLQIAPLPKLSGVQDGGVYVQTRTVEVFPGSGGLVRYEITSDGSEPPAVGETSPVWSSRLSFQAAAGETVEYRIRLRQYVPGYEPSEELAFSFTLDRTAPAPPRIRDFSEQEYVRSSRTVDFMTEDDGQAVYQISEYVYPPGELPLGWDEGFSAPAGMDAGELTTYSAPFDLEGLPGELVLYTIRAYAFDAAGNRSAQDRVWNLVIDRRNVYVSPLGSDGGDGSRGRPYAVITDAIDYARETGRSEIFLASGSYPVLRPISVDFALGFYGSYRPETWEISRESSFLFADKTYRASTLLDIRNSRVVLDGLYISDSARDLGQLIFASGSDVSIRSSLLTVSGGSTAASATGSTLRIIDSEINGYELQDATLIRVQGLSTLVIRDSRISAEDLPSFLENDLHGSYNLVSSQESTVSVSRSELVPASGDSTIAVFLYDSRFTGDQGSLFSSGYGTTAASAFYLEQSDLILSGATVQGSSEAAVVSLISGRDSNISLQDSDIVLQAAFGVNGVSLTGGSLRIADSRLYGDGGRDFVNTLVVRQGAELELENNRFAGAETAEYIFAFIEDSSVRISGNEFAFTGRESYGIAVHLGENASGSIEDNQFDGSIFATAIRLQTAVSEITMEVTGNTFENWGLLLQEFRESFRASQQQAGRYQTLQQLESLEGAGLIFIDNVINQGL